MGGNLEFIDGIISCLNTLLDFKPRKSKAKRILVFTGGPIQVGINMAHDFGKLVKHHGVAVDVVNFCLSERHEYFQRALDAFVFAANNNNNSHIEHINAGACTRIRDVLSRFLSMEEWEIISMEEEEIAAAASAAVRNKKAKDPEGKHQAAAHDAYVKARGMDLQLLNKFEVFISSISYLIKKPILTIESSILMLFCEV